ncbi:MAG: hypothetical protein E6Q89_05900 [Bacteroidia bacterium]|nr:MAG: hypothetical protein E6Q89_05900 [Bacteroidia bacterium]
MKRFKINTTETHLKVLHIVARMVNATPKAIAIALDNNNDRNYRGYLGDLFLDGMVYKKLIYGIAQNGKAGMRLGTLYALTKKGANLLEDSELMDGDIYYYKEGIRANSPTQTIHRIQLIHITAMLLQMEKREKLKVLQIIPYFQKQGAIVLGTSRSSATVTTSQGDIIPDALVRVEIGGKVRTIAIELHRTTQTTRILEQLGKHTEAIENRLFSELFEDTSISFVCSIHEQVNTLRNTIERIQEIEDFERYNKGFHFTSLDDLFSSGFDGAFYHANAEKSKLFDFSKS